MSEHLQMGPGRPLEPDEVLLAAVLDLGSTPLETGGSISDDTEYVVMTRESWLKIQDVIDDLGARAAFKAARSVMFPIVKENIIDPSRVLIKELDGGS